MNSDPRRVTDERLDRVGDVAEGGRHVGVGPSDRVDHRARRRVLRHRAGRGARDQRSVVVGIDDVHRHRLLGRVEPVAGNDRELVRRLHLEIRNGQQGHGAGRGIDRDACRIADGRLDGIGHLAEGRRDVGVGPRGGVDHGRSGRVLGHRTGRTARDHRSAVVGIDDVHGHRLLGRVEPVTGDDGEHVRRLRLEICRRQKRDSAGGRLDRHHGGIADGRFDRPRHLAVGGRHVGVSPQAGVDHRRRGRVLDHRSGGGTGDRRSVVVGVDDVQRHDPLGPIDTVIGDDHEQVRRLRLVVGLSEESHGAGRRVDRHPHPIPHARLDRIGDVAVGRRDVGIRPRRRVDDGADRGVLHHRRRRGAGEDRGVVVGVGDSDRDDLVAHKPARIGGCDTNLIDAVAIRIGRILEVGSDLKRQRAGDRMKSEQSPVGIVGRIRRDRVAERIEIPIGRRRDAGDGDVFGKVDDPRGGCELRGDVHVDHGHRVPRHHVASAVGGPHDHLGDIVGADVSRGRVPRQVGKSQFPGRAIDLEQPGIDACDHGKRGRPG